MEEREKRTGWRGHDYNPFGEDQSTLQIPEETPPTAQTFSPDLLCSTRVEWRAFGRDHGINLTDEQIDYLSQQETWFTQANG